MNTADSVLLLNADYSVVYFTTLAVSRLNHSVVGQLMNSKGYGRKRRRPNRGIISAFA
jgi:hypothetical protein